MANKYITQLQGISNPTFTGYTIFDDGITTYKLSIGDLKTAIVPNVETTGSVTYLIGDQHVSGTLVVSGSVTIINDVVISGTTTSSYFAGDGSQITNLPSVKNWYDNVETKIINSDETVVISGDYVLNNSNMYVLSSDTGITIGNLVFNKSAKIFIGGYLLLNNSTIVNDGEINVAGGVIFSGNSTITGTGILN